MSAILAEAAALVSSGETAGEGIWKAVEAMLSVGMIKEREAVSTFEAMLEQGTDKRGEDVALFVASARMLIPDVKLSADERALRINRKASAWADYVRDAMSREADDLITARAS